MIPERRNPIILGVGVAVLFGAGLFAGSAPRGELQARPADRPALMGFDVPRVQVSHPVGWSPRPEAGGQPVFDAALPVDTDDDGIPDDWETAHGLNPASPNDAWFDPDRDQVVNLFEYQLGSDPRSKTTPVIITVGPTAGADSKSLTVVADNAATGVFGQVSNKSQARFRILQSAIVRNSPGKNSDGHGIYAFIAGSGTLTGHVFNSILYGNAHDDLHIQGSPLTFHVDHTDLGVTLTTYGSKLYLGGVVLTVDPKFVSAAQGDSHLQSGSQLIDQGINSGIPLIDFEGDKRVRGRAPDIGPDEY